MSRRRFLGPTLAVAVLAGAAVGYSTRERWLPLVIPSAPPPAAGHPEGGHEHAHADRVKLSPQAQANLGLGADGAVDALSPQEYWRTVAIPGVVVDRPGESDRGVTARVAGVVTAIAARPGDTVKPGDPLFTVRVVSDAAQTAQTELFKAAQDVKLARELKARLEKADVVPPGRIFEVETQVRRAEAVAGAFRKDLAARGFTPEQVTGVEEGTFVTHVTVPAPGQATGSASDPRFEVQELRVQLGDAVRAGQTLCLLADHRRLFVEGRAFKSEAAGLARAAVAGQPVAAEFADEAPGDWGTPPGPLTIHHLSNQVDPQARTFAVYLPLENQARTFDRDGKTYLVWRFRPGQRVRLRVPVEKLGDGVFALPAGAVVREGPEAFVFVQSGDTFRRKPVRVLYEDRAEVVLADDGSIGAGEFVVRTPAAAALNRVLKAAAGGGHEGHDHHGHDHNH